MTKHAFWQALVVTLLLFGAGLVLGAFLESGRTNEVQSTLFDSETNLLDNQIRNRVIENANVSCAAGVRSTFDFADKIYIEALRLEDYEEASKFSDEFLVLHRRYDLLRALLWVDSLELRQKCGADFHTIVYLYDFDTQDVNIKARQIFYSRLLLDLKNKHGDDILLIPIAADTDLESVNLIVDKYDIEEYPSIIVDETDVISEILTLQDLEERIFQA